jgi:hypothetical protein
MDPSAKVALAAAFFRFFENDSNGQTAAISDQGRRARRWPLGHYQHKRGNKMKHRCKELGEKAQSSRFDSLVARYYPAVYRFASRLADDPRQAVLLTQRAFTSIRKQLWIPRDEIALVRILLKAVVRAGLTTA